MSQPPILRVLEHYGCPLPPNPKASGWSPCKCPFPGHDDKSPSASVDQSINKVMCMACGNSEDSYGFIMLMDGVDYPTAKRRAVEYGLETNEGRNKKAPKGKGPASLW